jgi:lipopolysaccharide export system permease protein
MIAGTLSRYFGLRFMGAVIAIFFGMIALVAMIDFVEMLRRSANIKDVSPLFVAKITFYRVPYLTERAMPFAVMAGAMYCYLNLSRRLELVIARSAGVSAWQFVAPAVLFALVIGIASTSLYNPLSATLREESMRLEAELFGRNVRKPTRGRG